MCIRDRHNIYEMPDIKQLIEKEVNETTEDKCCHYIEHTLKEEDTIWELAHITYVVEDSLINNNANSSDDKSSATDMEGIGLPFDNNG